jgi:sugar-specific transcriptional regulator TrmB
MPLRSATDFPATPRPEALETTYQECRAALVSANRSRGALKAESERRGVVIAELQRELVELEADLADQARAKARLHALNAKLGGLIRELEETGDAMVELIDESERQSGYWLVEMFRRLIEQAKRWRLVKARAATLAVEVTAETAAETAAEAGASSQLGRAS